MLQKPYLIAEIGINHNGDLNIAKKLIDIAKDNKFDAVKFQKRDINLVYSKEILDIPRESPWGTTTREQKHGLEFEKKEYDEINRYCKNKKIEWFASAWDLNSLNFLDQYDLKYHKVASAMIVDTNFLNEVANLIDKKYAIEQVRKLTQNNKKFNYGAKYMFKSKTFKIETLKKNLKYLKLKKQFNANWKAAAVANNKIVKNNKDDDKVLFNQLANRCEKQIKIVNKKFKGLNLI